MIECAECNGEFQEGNTIFECDECGEIFCWECKEKHKKNYDKNNSEFIKYNYKVYIERLIVEKL